MAKKLIFIFAGTGDTARNIAENYEKFDFNTDVIRVYVNGCQDSHVGGNIFYGSIDPNLDVVATKIRQSFAKNNSTTQINFQKLKKKLGQSIIIFPKKLDEIEEIQDITLTGFSRGAVTTFATARALNDLQTDMHILAIEPVTGDSSQYRQNKNSLFQKNADLSSCTSIVQAEVLLGTYSTDNTILENIYFQQMAPKFPEKTKTHIFLMNKKSHNEFHKRSLDYESAFFQNRGLTSTKISHSGCERIYVIPKVAQKKLSKDITDRSEYLPAFKQKMYDYLQSIYRDKNTPFPLQQKARFKYVQALLALHRSSIDKKLLNHLSEAAMASTDKSKGLREFIVELDAIIEYSQDKKQLGPNQNLEILDLKNQIYRSINQFYRNNKASLIEKEEFSQSIIKKIEEKKQKLPSAVYKKLLKLTTKLMEENTLIHPHLIKYIDESETLDSNSCDIKKNNSTNKLLSLCQLLYQSSKSKRRKIFNIYQSNISQWIQNTSDLILICPFLTPQQFSNILPMVGHTVNDISQLISLLEVVPSEQHKTDIFNFYYSFLSTNPTSSETIEVFRLAMIEKINHLTQKLGHQISTTYFSKRLKEYKKTKLEELKNTLEENNVQLLKEKLNTMKNDKQFCQGLFSRRHKNFIEQLIPSNKKKS